MLPNYHRALNLLAIILLTNTVQAESNNPNVSKIWNTECIGQYQLRIPGIVEVATNKPSSDAFTDNAMYSDGQISLFAQLQYFGYLNIVSPVSENEFTNFKNIIIAKREKYKQEYLNSGDEKEINWGNGYKPLAYDTSSMFAWDNEDHNPRITYYLANKIFTYSYSNNENDNASKKLNQKYFNNFLHGFHFRPLYEIPTQQGVCIPYGFISDDGTTPHNIAVTMRLIDHSDVEIGFKDSTYFEPTVEKGELSSGYLNPKDAINSFFNNSGVTNNLEKVESNFPGYHSIQMGGQKGGAVFFTIIREDKSKDYGYIAAVKGDDKAGVPSQLLYVIRTASRAKGQPVSKEELKDMAEKIVASVKHHPVQ